MPDTPASGLVRGYTGKVPVRGDFVHAGLPRGFLDPWGDWQAEVLAGSRELMGESWLEAFLEAPVWRFALPPGLCGTHAAVGLMLPSVDRVGRYFPLTFAALSDTEIGAWREQSWTDWLDAAEALGRAALDEDRDPSTLMPPPCPPPGASEGGDGSRSAWWTGGGPRVPAESFMVPGMPAAERFAAMLGHVTEAV